MLEFLCGDNPSQGQAMTRLHVLLWLQVLLACGIRMGSTETVCHAWSLGVFLGCYAELRVHG